MAGRRSGSESEVTERAHSEQRGRAQLGAPVGEVDTPRTTAALDLVAAHAVPGGDAVTDEHFGEPDGFGPCVVGVLAAEEKRTDGRGAHATSSSRLRAGTCTP